MTKNLLILLKWKSVNCFSKYDFDGDDIPIIVVVLQKPAYDNPKLILKQTSASRQLIRCYRQLIFLNQSVKDKPFLMAIEDVFSIEGRGTVATGRIERGVGQCW